ncbi:hypothetical protein PCIT_a3822 [Pseudoalteromonas citrea]|uniref:Acriflavin resistance protein n=2 Tax=Pseudoalteromonas citrea TaxID=43655 RepID=A0AAD4AGC0_9GAMM|nr:efflux RND transporter permease subunit [Pseudoalteromonas citrea]KAF7767735.1 hypothetical protein PCIT_a3822 [Pseudoalteromonas citrea]
MEKRLKRGGLIKFFIQNSVAANLLMMFVIVLGFVSYKSINKQIFPESKVTTIEVNVVHFGSSAKEIEERIVSKIEASLKSLPEIKRMRSWSNDSSGRLLLDVKKNADAKIVLDKVKLLVDATPSFPADIEPIIIQLNEGLQPVIRLALVERSEIDSFKASAREIYTELLNLNNVSVVTNNLPADEISIEVDPATLKMYRLTISDIRTALSDYSNNLSAGEVRSNSGIIPVRVENQAYDKEAFSNIPVITLDSGSQIKLKDIASVKDGFVEGVHIYTYSGYNAVAYEISATNDQDMVAVADSVKSYIEYKNKELSEGLQLEVIIDGTDYLDQRLSMMQSNLFQGAILVLVVLTLFLSFKLAVWVVVGLLVSFLGAMLMMPLFGVTINLISLFAFIMVLGLIVDDAIVVGESVDKEVTLRGNSYDAVEAGVKKVAKPAIFGVLTTIAVFFPFIFSDGSQSELFKGISVIVIFCLVFSIIESKLILPSHLANMSAASRKSSGFRYVLNERLSAFSHGPLANAVEWAVSKRWSVLLLFMCTFVFSLSLVHFGHVKSISDPMVPIDQPEISIELNDNASIDAVEHAAQTFQDMLKREEQKIMDEFGQGMIKDILIENSGQTDLKFTVVLVAENIRPINTFDLSRRWRENMPDIIALKAIHIKDDVLGRNNRFGDFGYFLFSDNMEDLNAAAKLLAAEFRKLEGVYEVGSNISVGRKELVMELKVLANTLGLTLSDIGRQVHHSYTGAEVERFNRNGEEIRVLVRYPQESRNSISELQYKRIQTPSGDEVFLGDVVSFIEQEAITTIRRESNKRSVYVFGSIDVEEVRTSQVISQVRVNILPLIKDKYPSVSTDIGGRIKETNSEKDQMLLFTVASLLTVYILLAIPLKSYFQPLLIMSIIPFCVVGSIFGHWVVAEDFSLVSIFGLIAAAGVVINDSLILVDRINSKISDLTPVPQSVTEAVSERFRAILLTSLTTFVGLLPIMFETSLQAKFVSPMAVSLGFAVLVSTCVTLFLVPILYVIGHNFSTRMTQFSAWFSRKKRMIAVSEP